MFDVSTVKNTFGKAANAYDRHAHLQRAVREHCFALAKRYWPPQSKILDLGAGTGAFTHEAALLKCGWDIVSLDLSFGMCRVAASYSKAVTNADAEQLPFANAQFNGIFSSLMLQWANNPQGVFSEMARVVKEQGVVIASTPVQGTLHELSESFKAIDNLPHVSRFMQAHDMLAAAEKAGFTLELAKQTPWVEYYPDTIALMRSLQAIGATNKEQNRKRGLMTPQQFATLEQHYTKHYATSQGLPATWQIVYLVLRRQ